MRGVEKLLRLVSHKTETAKLQAWSQIRIRSVIDKTQEIAHYKEVKLEIEMK